MPKIRNIFTRSRSDWSLFGEACVDMLYAWGALRLSPFERIVATVASQGHNKPTDAALIRRVRWAVEAAARYLPIRLTCLPQALAASWMLQARGFAPTLQYGVATVDAGRFEAHAWVELDGMPVIGHRAAPRFTLLTSFPKGSATS